MRTAIISDIHANLEALTAVLADIKRRSVDRIFCLGDIVGYGSNPNECIQLIQKYSSKTVIGNHDVVVFDPLMALEFNDNARVAIEWTHRILTKQSFDFLRSLTINHTEENVTLVHATPYDPHLWHYISSLEDARFNFPFFKTTFCFIGHTHIPGIILLESETAKLRIAPPGVFHYGKLSDTSRFMINVGSVGQPRDRDPRSSYLILDTHEKTFSFFRVEYDIASYQKKMTDLGMPPFLINRIAEGR